MSVLFGLHCLRCITYIVLHYLHYIVVIAIFQTILPVIHFPFTFPAHSPFPIPPCFAPFSLFCSFPSRLTGKFTLLPYWIMCICSFWMTLASYQYLLCITHCKY